jgi:hypothetical protein
MPESVSTTTLLVIVNESVAILSVNLAMLKDPVEAA